MRMVIRLCKQHARTLISSCKCTIENDLEAFVLIVLNYLLGTKKTRVDFSNRRLAGKNGWESKCREHYFHHLTKSCHGTP